MQPYGRILDLVAFQHLQQFPFVLIQVSFRLPHILPFFAFRLVVLPHVDQLLGAAYPVLKLQIFQQVGIVDIADLHFILQKNDLVDAILHPAKLLSGIQMLDVDDRDRRRRRTGRQQISGPRIHIQEKLQKQKQHHAEPQRCHTDDRHPSCIGDQVHHFAFTVQVGMLLTVQTAQILLDPPLILFRLAELLIAFLHLVRNPLHMIILLIGDLTRPLHEVRLAVLQLGHPHGAFLQLAALFLRKRLDLLHIL